jgi:hypothetical protein
MASATQLLLVCHLVLLTVLCTFTHIKGSISETADRRRSMHFGLGQYRSSYFLMCISIRSLLRYLVILIFFLNEVGLDTGLRRYICYGNILRDKEQSAFNWHQ